MTPSSNDLRFHISSSGLNTAIIITERVRFFASATEKFNPSDGTEPLMAYIKTNTFPTMTDQSPAFYKTRMLQYHRQNTILDIMSDE
ncbi:hypothetical protein QQG55_48850 [Brugia pahangi]